MPFVNATKPCKLGDFTIWLTQEAIAGWRPAKTSIIGRPREYSDPTLKLPVSTLDKNSTLQNFGSSLANQF